MAFFMPRTIAQGFEKLRANLEISDPQESAASVRQQAVRETLEKRLTVLDSFLTGSYRRSTMIAPASTADIDVLVVLDPRYYRQDGQTAVLDVVRKTLKERYRTSDVSRNGQAVTIAFEQFPVDVVPGFFRSGGGYLIPDPNRRRWIATDPKAHVTLSASANKTHGGNLVPLIKMLKAWNREHGSLFHSFHLEVLIFNALDGVTIADYPLPSTVRFFFEKAKLLVRAPLRDPAGYDSDVGAYLSAPRDVLTALTKVTKATDTAKIAEHLGNRGLVQRAYEKWQLLFGNDFPTYG